MPKFCCAIFQSESPGFTITALSFVAPFGAAETTGAAGATGAKARGCKGVGRTAGGREGGRLDVSREAAKVGQAMRDLTNQLLAMPNMAFFLPDFFPLPSTLRLRRAVRELNGIIYSMIRARRAANSQSQDLLQLLLDAQDEDGSQMTDEQLHDEMMTLFIAGHETTAIALSWTWYLLAQNPEVEGKLADELRQVLKGRAPWVSDLRALPYTEMVVKETMRLYPPAWVIGRQALMDFAVHGYRLLAGTNVLLAQWITQRDTRFYPEPERFNPDRWKDDPIRSGRLPRYAYFPFGSGPRVCIGAGFAMMEATLARHNRTEISSDSSLGPVNRNAALGHATSETWHKDGASGTASRHLTIASSTSRL